MKNNKKIIILALSLFGAIVIVWGVAFAINSGNNTPSKKNNDSSEIVSSKKLPTGDVDQIRKDALSATTKILESARENPTNETVEERTVKLDAKDFSVVGKDLQNSVIFADMYEDSSSLQANTYQAIIYMAELLKDNPEASDLSWKNVFVDQESGIAFVPLSAFRSDAGLFYFEMIYTDGTWKLLPNSFVNSVLLGSSITNMNQEVKPTQ